MTTAYTPDQLTTRDEQRLHIQHLVLAGEWKGSTTVRDLVAQWKMPARYVRQLCDEAWGAVRGMRRPGWEDEFEACMAELEALKAAAWSAKAYVGKEALPVDQPNLAIVLNALRTQLQIYGKLERPGAGADRRGTRPDEGDYESLTTAQKRALLEQELHNLDSNGEQRH